LGSPEHIFDFNAGLNEPLVPTIQQGIPQHLIECPVHGFARRLRPKNLLSLADLCRINHELIL
jgi:hypothetical protein